MKKLILLPILILLFGGFFIYKNPPATASVRYENGNVCDVRVSASNVQQLTVGGWGSVHKDVLGIYFLMPEDGQSADVKILSMKTDW